jgi:hypothetical protein
MPLGGVDPDRILYTKMLIVTVFYGIDRYQRMEW